jgi:hypothetical protein
MRIRVGGPLLLIWLSAFVLFVAQVLISLGLEFKETTFGNIGSIILMYFTYCQAWLFMGVRNMFRPIRVKGIPHWEKTQRF